MMRQSFCDDVRKLQQSKVINFDNHSYPSTHEYAYPVENGFQFMPFHMVSDQVYNHEYQLQEFQYFVVMDFEATCDKVMQPNPQEIIEFPSVIVNSLTGQIEDCFQTYLRPTHHPLLTDFCKELTGIQQTQVDGGVSLSKALFMHDKWLRERGVKHTSFTIVTWTDWDCRTMLESECRLKGIYKPPYFDSWINLKAPFHEIFGRVRCNLKEAVKLAGLTWEGRAHCGLDDARNTAQLLIHLMRRGFKFSTTSSMELPQTHSNCHVSSMNQMEKQKEKMVIGNSMECLRTCLDSKVNYLNQFEKQEEKAVAVMEVQSLKSPIKTENKYCLCGVKSNKCVVHKPGPKQGNLFFSCSNWPTSRQGICDYFI
ncbi:hypothetical protein IEQ34_004993 [Dendrobium chrysotoxum]|uniref:GRF-type domain-containing protein n=1 Tax=Dendrobium chrysotoxum TaxID=161865 RepID=A0AAV7H9W6_DENCH|nr:hypothetical protein IEQ34_004993 [Dendrobium chrysotoxum]